MLAGERCKESGAGISDQSGGKATVRIFKTVF